MGAFTARVECAGLDEEGEGLVEDPFIRHEEDEALAAAGEEHAIGVHAELEGIADERARATAGAQLPCRRLPPEIIAPADDGEVEFEALRLELGATGTGLGLAVVRRIMESHGGTITYDTEVGVGTTFTLRLPVTPPLPSPRSLLAAEPPAQTNGNGPSAGRDAERKHDAE